MMISQRVLGQAARLIGDLFVPEIAGATPSHERVHSHISIYTNFFQDGRKIDLEDKLCANPRSSDYRCSL
jgi:hypothetical protein